MLRAAIIFILAAILFPFCMNAQNEIDSVRIRNEFYSALDLYNNNKFEESEKIFSQISTVTKFNPSTTISYIFTAKSFLKLGDIEQADKILYSFISKFPNSNYINEAQIMLAKINLEGKKYIDSFKNLTDIIEHPQSTYYLKYAESCGELLTLKYLSPTVIRSVYDSSSNMNLRPYLLFISSKYYYLNNKIDSSKFLLDSLLNTYPISAEKINAESLMEKIKNGSNANHGTPLIAVLLPLDQTSINSQNFNAGNEILEGIKFALSEYNNKHREEIGLLIKNTGRSKEKIENIKREVDSLDSLKVIIGPIYSDEVKETLETFKNTSIPIISPTATDEGLTEMYPDFFQANPTFIIRGKIMAEYIFYVENKRAIAILNSEGGYSEILANSFAQEFEKLGGKIIIWQKFKAGNINLSEQINKIAKDSLKLQGVYLPLNDSQDVAAILSQFLSSNLNITIYGNQDWLQAKGLETSSDLSDRLTISSDYFLDYNDSTFQQFQKSFFVHSGLDINRNVLYGYDITNYVLSFLGNSDITRTELKRKLESKKIFKGLHNNIYFDESRINKFINIIRYKNGKFELIDKFKAG